MHFNILRIMRVRTQRKWELWHFLLKDDERNMLTGYWLNDKVLPFLFVTPLKFPIWPPVVTPIWPPLATIKAYCQVHKIVHWCLRLKLSKETYWLHYKLISEASQSWFAYKHRAFGGLSKMAVNWLQNWFITNRFRGVRKRKYLY